MELDVPKIEPLGYYLSDIQDDNKTWFQFRNVYFNATWERTERYCLFEIPFFKERLKKLTLLTTNVEIENFIAPYRERMKVKKKNGKRHIQEKVLNKK